MEGAGCGYRLDCNVTWAVPVRFSSQRGGWLTISFLRAARRIRSVSPGRFGKGLADI